MRRYARWWLALALVAVGIAVIVMNYRDLLPGGTSERWLWTGLGLCLLGVLLLVAFVVGSITRASPVNDDER
jgi:drug/metabolite transporter (DMT)-like permease